MAKRLMVLLALAGCASEAPSGPRPVPSTDVLCQVWQGNGVKTGNNSFMGVPGYGSLSTDVIAAWGEPDKRSGDVWTYDWSGKTVTLTFEQHNLCLSGKPVSGSWLSDIKADGIAFQRCWNYEFRGGAKTCDGCFGWGEVQECL